MKMTLITLGISAVLLASACSKANQTATTSTAPTTTAGSSIAATAAPSMTPEQLGQLGALINKQPANADKLLADQGLTQETFESAIRKVSSDPAASKRYAAAYKSAS
ncbi:MAG TPA: hypothetical protein VHX14_02590 [Thermoanaerobaculia bacterium]|jgi:hypothetical protein|nr:hypothetical protein [Thermoanaerobaculia bacterium]